MKAIAIFPFLLSSIVTYSQTKNADSLKLMLPLSSGIERADVLYDVAFELVDTDYNLALFYGRKARNAAKNTGDSLRVVKAGRITALAFRRLEMLDSSLSLSLQIIPIVLIDRKLAERTHDLQLNRDTLLRACEERDLIINKASKDIKTSLLTLKGLCTVGLQDVEDPKALEYIYP